MGEADEERGFRLILMGFGLLALLRLRPVMVCDLVFLGEGDRREATRGCRGGGAWKSWARPRGDDGRVRGTLDEASRVSEACRGSGMEGPKSKGSTSGRERARGSWTGD